MMYHHKMFETEPLTIDKINELRDRYAASKPYACFVLSVQEAEKLFAVFDAIEWIAHHEEGDAEPGDKSSRRAACEMSQRARKALGEVTP